MAACTMSLCRNIVCAASVPFRPMSSTFRRTFWSYNKVRDVSQFWSRRRLFGGLCLAGLAGTAVAVKQPVFDTPSDVSEVKKIPKFKPIRKVKSETDSSGLKVTLYQYQNCPFCCKVRSYLDFHGLSYDVVEVNSLRRGEIKWSQYKKVPIVVCEVNGNDDKFVQLNDSSLIISVLESFLEDTSQSMEQLISYYPPLQSVNSRGKKVVEFPNKYFIMYGGSKPVPKYRDDERKWRQWTDEVLVHTISPNIYRTPGESLQAFRFFSEAGDWKRAFSTVERGLVIYAGAASMYFIGRILKKRHALKDDVRLSLYDACNEWTAELAKQKTPFMGGSLPNLADLAVYGVFSSIEGCQTFDDLVHHTKISDWYFATKKEVQRNAGRLLEQ